MKLEHDISIVHTTHPFVIARGGASEHRLIRVRIIDDDGVEGWGEAAPNRFYGETADTALGALDAPRADRRGVRSVGARRRRSRDEPRASLQRLGEVGDQRRAARSRRQATRRSGLQAVGTRSGEGAAVELHDRDRARTTTSCASASRRRRQYPVLKVKLGTDRDEQIIRTVRDAAPDKVLRVDANAAWTPKHALRMIDVLVELRRRVRRAAAAAARSRGPALRARALVAAGDRRRVVRRRDRHPAARRRRRRHQHQALEVRRPARGAAR